MAQTARKNDGDIRGLSVHVGGGPALEPSTEQAGSMVPELRRDAIAWQTRGSRIEVIFDVVNRSGRRTEPGRIIVEAAPLGAFVPGVSVARVRVPAMDPGERRRMSVGIEREALPSLARLHQDIVRMFGVALKDREIQLLSSAEWAGNLNLWFDVAPERAVDVHRALNLEVESRRTVAIGVFLPQPHRGFEIATVCGGLRWSAEIVRLSGGLCLLVVRPPGAGVQATVNLLVTRRSDGRSVAVEFSFHSVDRPGEQLGCCPVS